MVFPVADVMVRSFLLSQIPAIGENVHINVPSPRPDRFIVCRRNGGDTLNRIVDRPVMTVDCWGTSSADAAGLASLCQDAFLHNGHLMPLVRRVRVFSGPYSVPDDESGQPRYRLSLSLTVRSF